MNETAIKERPILFSQPMVRAILEGRKSMTRRALNRNKQYGPFAFDDPRVARYCPYGQPGDRLYVKEALVWFMRTDGTCGMKYKADGQVVPASEAWPWQKSVLHGMWMPRWAARLFLEITDIRVERLQDISEEDAQREGWDWSNHDLTKKYDPITMDTARRWFAELWDYLNGDKHPWASNPWVWVISFRVVHP